MLSKLQPSVINKLMTPLFVFVAVVIASISTLSFADSIEYEIEIGSSPGFSHSFLHSASGEYAAGYFARGNLLLALRGTLSGTWDASTQTFTAGSSSILNGTFDSGATAANLANEFGIDETQTAASTWQVEITGGSVTMNGSFAEGTLNYNVIRNHPTLGVGIVNAGTFYFDPYNFPGVPNSISENRLDLWGNNWTGDTAQERRDNKPTSAALGIDLGGGGAIVPTPTAALAGLVMLGGIGMRRRTH